MVIYYWLPKIPLLVIIDLQLLLQISQLFRAIAEITNNHYKYCNNFLLLTLYRKDIQ